VPVYLLLKERIKKYQGIHKPFGFISRHVVLWKLLIAAEESKPLTVLICVWYIHLFTRVEEW
jgi:hypothetical protein